MKIFTHISEIQSYLRELRSKGNTIGFVPTMGALHEGHLALIKQAKNETDQVVCSIFVNPLQFNRKEDLDNYPDRLLQDRSMLENEHCDILFLPVTEEMYPDTPPLEFAFGTVGIGMEAKHRPKHFEGVAAVINRFFEILEPTVAYFGEKDYQQLAIVKWLVKEKKFKTEVVGCDTIRFESGLAMSSRNYLLVEKDLKIASQIYEALQYCKLNTENYEPKELAKRCFSMLQDKFSPEYFTIVDEESMVPLNKWSDSQRPRAFVAAYLSSVRLIDNLSLNP